VSFTYPSVVSPDLIRASAFLPLALRSKNSPTPDQVRGDEAGWEGLARKIGHLLPLAALVFAAPALADDLPADLAESRLRGCLLAGSSGTGQTQLEAAVIQVRAYCGAQIRRVQDQRVEAATQGLSGNEAEAAKTRATRALNAEIAQAVANFSGLQF
jgi:hypothetical protein